MVESDGPPLPPETTNAWVNDWNAWMICSTRLKKMIGDSNGSVMLRNCRAFDAPSTAAASWYIGGSGRSPARKITIGAPNVHTFSTIRVDSAVLGSEIQLLVCAPN